MDYRADRRRTRAPNNSQRAERDPTCETRVFRALDELEAR